MLIGWTATRRAESSTSATRSRTRPSQAGDGTAARSAGVMPRRSRVPVLDGARIDGRVRHELEAREEGGGCRGASRRRGRTPRSRRRPRPFQGPGAAGRLPRQTARAPRHGRADDFPPAPASGRDGPTPSTRCRSPAIARASKTATSASDSFATSRRVRMKTATGGTPGSRRRAPTARSVRSSGGGSGTMRRVHSLRNRTNSSRVRWART